MKPGTYLGTQDPAVTSKLSSVPLTARCYGVLRIYNVPFHFIPTAGEGRQSAKPRRLAGAISPGWPQNQLMMVPVLVLLGFLLVVVVADGSSPGDPDLGGASGWKPRVRGPIGTLLGKARPSNMVVLLLSLVPRSLSLTLIVVPLVCRYLTSMP